MIERQREVFGWEFIFMGADIKAVAQAEVMGIKEDRAVRYRSDSYGTDLNYRTASDAVSSVRRGKNLCADWKRI